MFFSRLDPTTVATTLGGSSTTTKFLCYYNPVDDQTVEKTADDVTDVVEQLIVPEVSRNHLLLS